MESSFQFTNPVLKNITFSLNNNFNNQENKKIQLTINISTQIFKESGENEAVVELNLKIGERKSDCPFLLTLLNRQIFVGLRL